MTNEEKILQFKPVSIRDDLMFGTVMSDPECCKPFLETILGTKIKKIEYPERQKTIDIGINSKSVRMDVYVEDEKGTDAEGDEPEPAEKDQVLSGND